jgi:hypothetical protein
VIKSIYATTIVFKKNPTAPGPPKFEPYVD